MPGVSTASGTSTRDQVNQITQDNIAKRGEIAIDTAQKAADNSLGNALVQAAQTLAQGIR